MKTFRIAIIGAGVWGDTHAAIYREHPLVVDCSPSNGQ